MRTSDFRQPLRLDAIQSRGGSRVADLVGQTKAGKHRPSGELRVEPSSASSSRFFNFLGVISPTSFLAWFIKSILPMG